MGAGRFTDKVSSFSLLFLLFFYVSIYILLLICLPHIPPNSQAVDDLSLMMFLHLASSINTFLT